jgi:hypothetical protein
VSEVYLIYVPSTISRILNYVGDKLEPEDYNTEIEKVAYCDNNSELRKYKQILRLLNMGVLIPDRKGRLHGRFLRPLSCPQ